MPVNLTRHGRLLLALLLAGLLHAGLILGISINRPRPNEIDKTLDVILVVNHSLAPPAKADFLAQSPQKGGGESKKRTLPKATPKLAAPIEPKVALTPRKSLKEETEDTPTKHNEMALPEPRTEKPIADKKTVAEENLESSPNSVLQVPKSDKKTVGGVAHKTAIEPVSEPPRLSSALLSQQIAEVTTEFNKSREDQAKLHRMVYINSVNAHKYHAAAYEAAWQEKVEQIGNLNYPEEAQKQNLSGSLLLAVGIKADGSIYSIIVRQSSGEPVLDEAAQRIVRLAAPFAAFPKELQEEADVLIITRTWLFSADNRLETGN